jgi:hypothetical protein
MNDLIDLGTIVEKTNFFNDGPYIEFNLIATRSP